ncbi:hypothetical protein [uncultured Thomasclavelia sp.]|uniref:hypothetical protein n=1 Tax=uncultured Thomasclavelia sp. TaxID=3025759 RepID=UPI00280BB5AD|nr:hypothetical protein [uncultured Thomasclavelia sp.]
MTIIKEAKYINNIIFIPSEEKQNVTVGFSKKEFKNHKGISELKYYLIVMYLRKHLQTFGQVSLTLNNLLEECGYSTKSHNKSIYSDFREIIKIEVLNKGYATCEVDIFTVNPTEMFVLQLSEKKSLFHTKDNFVQFSISEYEQITKSDSKINKSILTGVYLFIKQYIMDYPDNIISPPKISYPSKQQIKKGIGIASATTIENAIHELSELGMIYIRSDMFVEYVEEKDLYIPTRNVFALNEEELYGDTILVELERIYGKKVYNKDDVPGELMYLPKQKG